MSNTKCSCGCQKLQCCKDCAYKNPLDMDPIEYDYWNQTWWLNWNTTDGWGAFPSSESGQNNNTFDNLSGFGTSADAKTNGQANWPYCKQNVSPAYFNNRSLPNGKKLVRVYKFNNRFYQKAGDLVFYNNSWTPVADIPNVEKIFTIITV